MRRVCLGALLVPVSVLVFAPLAHAQQNVTLTDTSQTTTLTATVNEQARVTVPAGVSFNVVDLTANTSATAASVTVQNIVLASATKQLKVSVQANAASFTPPAPGATTWSAGDVSWNAATWTNATGSSGTLSSSAYNTIATCAADAGDCSTSGLVFTLGSKAGIKRSGNHTIVVTWKFESIGS